VPLATAARQEANPLLRIFKTDNQQTFVNRILFLQVLIGWQKKKFWR